MFTLFSAPGNPVQIECNDFRELQSKLKQRIAPDFFKLPMCHFGRAGRILNILIVGSAVRCEPQVSTQAL